MGGFYFKIPFKKAEMFTLFHSNKPKLTIFTKKYQKVTIFNQNRKIKKNKLDNLDFLDK